MLVLIAKSRSKFGGKLLGEFATVYFGIYIRYHVRQSNIQLTCFSYCRSSVKTRLRCSLLNCDYTLQVLQKVATNDCKPNGRCISQTVKQGCASVHIVKQQTATFQTIDPESVNLYATYHRLTCIIHTDVYNLDLRILTYTPVWVNLSYIDTLPEKAALLKPFALVVNKER